jgi:hypothetical protein
VPTLSPPRSRHGDLSHGRAAGATSVLPPKIIVARIAPVPRELKQKLTPRNLLLLDSPKTHETVLKHCRSRFSPGTKSPGGRALILSLRSTNQEIAMTAIAKAFSNVIPAISPDVDILKTVALFCGVGLFVSLLLASYGLDMSAGFF